MIIIEKKKTGTYKQSHCMKYGGQKARQEGTDQKAL